MRFKIESKHSIEDIFAILKRMMERMESLGATSASGVNLYFNPINEAGEKIVLVDENDDPVEAMMFRDVPKQKVSKVKKASVAVIHPKPELRSVA